MKFKVYQSKLSQVSKRFNLLMVISLGLLMSNVMLGSLSWYAIKHEKRHITPFFMSGGYEVSDTRVDAKYLDMMAMNFIDARLNVTSATVTPSFERLLQYVDASFYPVMLKRLRLDTKNIKANHISSTFVADSVLSNPRALTTTVSGTLNRYVGDDALSPIHRTYQLKYRYQSGLLTIVSFAAIKEKEGKHD